MNQQYSNVLTVFTLTFYLGEITYSIASNLCTVVDMCNVHCLLIYSFEHTSPRLYVKDMLIDFIATFEENVEKCPPP